MITVKNTIVNTIVILKRIFKVKIEGLIPCENSLLIKIKKSYFVSESGGLVRSHPCTAFGLGLNPNYPHQYY